MALKTFSFSNPQINFSIKFLSNFSHMNVLLYDFFIALKTLRFSNLQFNYTSRINCNRKLKFKSKMEETRVIIFTEITITI